MSKLVDWPHLVSGVKPIYETRANLQEDYVYIQ